MTILCWVDEMSRVHVVSFYHLISTARARCWEVDTFSPPIFEERAWERG